MCRIIFYGLLLVGIQVQAQLTRVTEAPNCACAAATAGFVPSNHYTGMDCTTDGKPAPDPCTFANLKYLNKTIGLRSCDKNLNVLSDQEIDQYLPQDQRAELKDYLNGVHFFCMNDGNTYQGPMRNLLLHLKANPGLGSRCHRPCPCTHKCPTGKFATDHMLYAHNCFEESWGS